MDRANRSSRSMRLKAQADRLAVDLILDCERAASRRDPRLSDPTRWSRTAWPIYQRVMHLTSARGTLESRACRLDPARRTHTNGENDR